MKINIVMTIMMLISCSVLHGQISTNEEPISFQMNIPVLRKIENAQKIMPALDMKELEQEDREDEVNGIPPRFGYQFIIW